MTAGGSAWWNELKPFYLKEMVHEVDERVARGGFPAPSVQDLASLNPDD